MLRVKLASTWASIRVYVSCLVLSNKTPVQWSVAAEKVVFSAIFVFDLQHIKIPFVQFIEVYARVLQQSMMKTAGEVLRKQQATFGGWIFYTKYAATHVGFQTYTEISNHTTRYVCQCVWLMQDNNMHVRSMSYSWLSATLKINSCFLLLSLTHECLPMMIINPVLTHFILLNILCILLIFEINNIYTTYHTVDPTMFSLSISFYMWWHFSICHIIIRCCFLIVFSIQYKGRKWIKVSENAPFRVVFLTCAS